MKFPDSVIRKIFILATLTGLLQLPAQAIDNPPAWGLGHPFTLEDLPFGDFRTRLESLPEPARQRAMAWLHRFSFTEQDLPFLRIDGDGGVYYVDTFNGPGTVTESEPADGLPAASATAGDAFSLHSRPGAGNILYLDFDGHIVPSTTAWTSIDLHAVPYDTDDTPGSFSQEELASIAEIWRRVSEDFAPFDVDVTTQEPATFGPTTGRLLVTTDTDSFGNAMPSQGAGGVAYVGVWGRSDYASRYSPAFVYYNRLGNGRADYVTEAASHEAGHNLFLSHDASNGSSYYGGHGTGDVSWGPIMGTGYGRNVSQWSMGEYTGANNSEDDIGILDSKLARRSDDHGDLMTSATRLVSNAGGAVSATTPAGDPDNLQPVNKGIIETRSDADIFYFDTDGGAATLTVTPAWQDRYTRGANLDVLASLLDAGGNLLVAHDPQAATASTVAATLPAGRYYLVIEGTGSTVSPYSDYGSLGQYFISGSLPAINDGAAPLPDPMSWSQPPQATGRDSIGMTATTAVDESGIVEYRFECISGSSGCTASNWQQAPSWTASNLQAGSSYEFRVLARDAFLNTTAASLSAVATTDSNLAPVASDDSATTAENTPVDIQVLDNDSDPEGDQLRVSTVSQGTWGSVTNNSGSVSYLPDPGFTGQDSFSYSIDDGYGGSASATVMLTISAANQSPLAQTDSVAIAPGAVVVISVLDNDSDPDGDPLSITAVGSANKGVASWQPGDDTITYAHNARRKGSDSFSYTISDGRGGSATGTVSVNLGSDGDSGGSKGGGKGGRKK